MPMPPVDLPAAFPSPILLRVRVISTLTNRRST